MGGDSDLAVTVNMLGWCGGGGGEELHCVPVGEGVTVICDSVYL